MYRSDGDASFGAGGGVVEAPAAGAPSVEGFWSQPKFFEALGSPIESICARAAEVLEAKKNGYADLPLVTISSTDPVNAWRRDMSQDLAVQPVPQVQQIVQ